MKSILTLFRTTFKILSAIAPELGSWMAFKLFQRPINKNIRRREQIFYQEARHFLLRSQNPPIHGYEMGNPNGKLVVLVHGWESNAGSMYKIAKHLADKGYRVMSLDLPAHGKSEGKATNIRGASGAIISLLEAVNPQEPFSLISHSFGSAASALALSESSYQVRNLIFLTSPDFIEDITKGFQSVMGFSDRVLKGFQRHIEKVVGKPLDEIAVSKMGKKMRYEQLTLIHDRFDKILPYGNSERIAAALPNAKLIPLERVGHYRMLWEEEVIEHIEEALEGRAVGVA